MNRYSAAALAAALLGGLVSVLITFHIFEAVPHLEDEIAYLWQAEVLARGQLTIPSPPEPKSFLVPFVVDYQGQRFGKYPIGWPAVLALGVAVGARWLVNPILAGLSIWLTFLLGRRVFGEAVGLMAAGLTLTSPFFLLNSGSLLSHPLGLVLAAGFALAWLKGFGERDAPRRWPYTLLAALLMGALVLARPFTAVGVALPFALHGLYLLVWGGRDRVSRWNTRLHLVSLAVLIVLLGSLHFAWQYRVTGDPFLNPYTLWWSYDKVGFGPGVGVSEDGHTLRLAWINTRYSLNAGYRDLFGWYIYSWILLPFGLLASLVHRRWMGVLLGSVFLSLVLLHIAYWVGSALFGPRYYYEGLFSLTIFTAAGIAFLAGFPLSPGRPTGDPAPPASDLTGQPEPAPILAASAEIVPLTRRARLARLRPWLVMAGVAALVAYNLILYTPRRLDGMRNLYDISRQNLEPFMTAHAQSLPPTLFIVHSDSWMGYGALLELQDPWLTSHFIFAWSRGPRTDALLEEIFSGERQIYHYYVTEPFVFYRERVEE
jgi:hypothetical protein